MSRFQNLLSHQGPLTHVNHSHRREAPTGRYTFDEITGEPRELQSEIFDEPPPQPRAAFAWHEDPTPEEIVDEPPPQPRAAFAWHEDPTPEEIAVNYQVVVSKGQSLTALLSRLGRMEPKTEFLESEIRWVQSEIDRATRQMNAQTLH